jgi:hypothetical protein
VKLKLNKRQGIVAGIVALAVFGLMASRSAEGEQAPGALDEPGLQACNDFADGYPDAETKPERLALADKVMASTRDTGNDPVKDRAAEMGIAADDGGSAWRASANALTDACRSAGWVAR